MRQKRNIFGFGRKPEAPVKKRRSSGLTIASASRMAKEAGYRGSYSFADWLRMKRLEDRNSGLISRLGDAYRAGVDARERDDLAKERAREAKREKQREQAERASIRKRQQQETDARATKLSRLDEKALERHYAKGGSLEEFLRQNPRARAIHKRNPIPAAVLGAANDYLGYQATGAAFAEGSKLMRPVMRGALKNAGRRNPAQAAEEAFEEFHGHAPEETVTVTKQVHFHRHLAAAGRLKSLVIRTENGKYKVTLTFDKNTLLCFNEAKNQLFIEGGDQSVPLEDFDIDPEEAHESEMLGQALKIGYHTRKDHLGSEGGTATYVHTFRMTNENGRHVTVRIAKYPYVIYRVLDQALEFTGGSYIIRAEGVDK